MIHSRLLWLFLIAQFCVNFGFSQEIIKMEGKSFDEDLPYRAGFFIETPRFHNGVSNDICEIEITCEGKGSGKNIVRYYHDWEESKDEDAFKIFIDESLEYGDSCKFKFSFYKRTPFSQKETLVQRLLDESEAIFYSKRNSISPSDIEAILSEILKDITLSENYFKITDNTWSKSSSILEKPKQFKIKFPIKTLNGEVSSYEFADLVTEKISIENKADERIAIIEKIEERSKDIMRFLRDFKGQNLVQLKELLLVSSVDEIYSFFENKRTESTSTYEIEHLIKSKDLLNCDSLCNAYLSELQGLYNDLYFTDKDLEKIRENERKIEAKLGTISDITEVIFSLSSSVYLSAPVEVTKKVSFNKIRIGTSFGGAITALNGFQKGPTDYASFGYFALKFNLRPIDRDLPRPWLTEDKLVNRSSIFIGIKALGNLNYRGGNLGSVFGTNPVAGISYDLSPYLSLDVGTVLFTQEVNQFTNRQTSVRAGLTVGISIDPDLINRFRSLLSSDKYKLN